MAKKNPKLWLYAKDYLIIIFGIALYGLGFCAFIATAPEKVVIGGMAGLSQVVDMITFGVWGFHVPYSVTIFSVNILMLVLAWKIVGRTFVIRTLFGVVVISTMMALFQPMFTHPPVEGQSFMNVIIGAVLCGLGIGLVFIHNGSTGGTDIISCLVERKNPHLQVGGILTAVDILIIALSIAVFGNLESGLYGIVALYAQGRVMDAILYGRKRGRSVMIFSEKREEIARRIMREMDRGATFLQSRGAYSGARSEVLLCAVGQREYAKLRRIVRECDPEAFFVVLETKNVYGEGFQPINEET